MVTVYTIHDEQRLRHDDVLRPLQVVDCLRSAVSSLHIASCHRSFGMGQT